MTRAARVAITQPYVPVYREQLFAQVIDSLARQGVEARVFFGGDVEQMRRRRERGDMADVPWATQVRARVLRLGRGGRHAIYRELPSGWRDAVLLTEMQAGNVNAIVAAARRRPFVTWGHGAAYTTDDVRVASWLESRVNRRAAHVLTYTEGGRRAVIDATGLPADRVTSFDNSTDTAALRDAVARLDDAAIDRYRQEIGLPGDAVPALLLGALNEHKLPELVRDAAVRTFARDPRAWLVVAGDGPCMATFRELADRTGRVTVLGQITTQDIARAGSVSRFVLNPGRVGLVAVDALALGLPVLTTLAGRHAPELEYLREGEEVVTVDGSAEALTRAWLDLVRRDTGGDPVTERSSIPSIAASADVVARTLRGVVEAVA
ncbi:glycosyltransferase family 4 protein [Cellulosimicrobium terreum]|nr:glycosyltransferase family 4 protein [Cellulosimicrobium terreum]